MNYNDYQKKIFDWVENGLGNAFINALAGCGKSTTLVHSSKLIKGNKNIFVAFNKSIQKELEYKLKGSTMQAVTFHSLGFNLIKTKINPFSQVKLNNRKIDDIFKKLDIFYKQMYRYKQIVTLIKAYNINYKNIDDINDCIMGSIVNVPQLNKTQHIDIVNIMDLNNNNIDEIDFDDMIYLPLVYDVIVEPYDWIYIDEAQDNTTSQLQLIEKFIGDNTRILMCGDKKQIIYGFRHSNIRTMEDFIDKHNCIEFDLPITYRCPKSHISLVKNYVPNIEAFEKNEIGIVKECFDYELPKIIDKEAFILARTNKQVIKVILNLIANNIKATYYGKDYGKILLNIIDRYINKYTSYTKFITKLRQDKEEFGEEIKEINTTLKKITSNSDITIEEINSMKQTRWRLSNEIDIIETIYEIGFRLSTFKELIKTINDVFLDNINGVVGSTIHKVKGMEFDNVYVIQEKLPYLKETMTPEEKEQEYNLHYVAHTRSKHKIVLVNNI